MRETKAKADGESVAALDRIERAARETVDIGWTFDPHIAQDFATVREALTRAAAAPTMYEALREVRRLYAGQVQNDGEYGPAIEAIDAALATATPSPKED